MNMIFIEILQLNWYAVPELPLSRNPLHNCTMLTPILRTHTKQQETKKTNAMVMYQQTTTIAMSFFLF